MALEDITDKIIAKGRHEAQEILDDARRECDELKQKTEARLDARIAAALERAEAEAHTAEERIVASAELDAKKHELAARQEAITQVLDRAIEKLTLSDEKTHLAFLQGKLEQAPFHGEAELIVSEKDHQFIKANLSALQTALEKAGRTLTIRLSSETREMGGGFVLRQGKIEFNASFASIRRSKSRR